MKKKKQEPAEPRSLLIRDMIRRGALNGGVMRDRRKRRPKDARQDKTRRPDE